MLANMKKILLI